MIFLLTFTATLTSCIDDEPKYKKMPKQKGEVFYIVGYSNLYWIETDTTNGTSKATVYMLIAEETKGELLDTLFLFNLPDSLFTFSSELVYEWHGYRKGIFYFPEEIRYDYKVRMTYRQMTNEELDRDEYREQMFPGIARYVGHWIEFEQKVFATSISRERK